MLGQEEIGFVPFFQIYLTLPCFLKLKFFERLELIYNLKNYLYLLWKFGCLSYLQV